MSVQLRTTTSTMILLLLNVRILESTYSLVLTILLKYSHIDIQIVL